MEITTQQLSPAQASVLEAFKKGENIFVTGPGGTGKTALIKHLFRHAKENDKNIQVCAMTGCAAVLLGCEGTKTLHSWAGIGLASGSIEEVSKKVITTYLKAIVWKKTDILIVDEVSMLSKKLFDMLNYIGQRIRRSPHLPFGGIQLVFSGDFYQLPPVGNHEQADTREFCFESLKWNETFHSIIQLTAIFRQKDESYCKVLNQIRVGKLSKSSYQKLIGRVKDFPSEIECPDGDEPKNTIALRPTILMAKRKDVEFVNQRELRAIVGETNTYNIGRVGDLTSLKSACENELKYLENNIIADKTLVLKVGSQVMCVANLDMEGPFPIVNGSQGIVTSFVNKIPMVKFNDGQTRLIGEHTWVSENYPKLGVKQIPLILAWAITIHKAQGATLDLVELDAGNSIFECGQTYVALSRVKSLSGLYLRAFDPQKIKINRKVQLFYNSLSSL